VRHPVHEGLGFCGVRGADGDRVSVVTDTRSGCVLARRRNAFESSRSAVGVICLAWDRPTRLESRH
jgi:hypothetical protein